MQTEYYIFHVLGVTPESRVKDGLWVLIVPVPVHCIHVTYLRLCTVNELVAWGF